MCLPAFYRRAVIAMSLSLCALSAVAGPSEKAKRIHDRLAGTPPSAAVLDKMQRAITGDPSCGIPAQIGGCTSIGAAYLAMQNPAFYSATLKNWVSPWTNRDGDKFAPLNDYSATVIGVVRDELDYRRVLYDEAGRFLRVEADPELDGSFVPLSDPSPEEVRGGKRP